MKFSTLLGNISCHMFFRHASFRGKTPRISPGSHQRSFFSSMDWTISFNNRFDCLSLSDFATDYILVAWYNSLFIYSSLLMLHDLLNWVTCVKVSNDVTVSMVEVTGIKELPVFKARTYFYTTIKVKTNFTYSTATGFFILCSFRKFGKWMLLFFGISDLCFEYFWKDRYSWRNMMRIFWILNMTDILFFFFFFFLFRSMVLYSISGIDPCPTYKKGF